MRACGAFLGLALLGGCRQNVDLDAVRAMSAKAAHAQQSFDLVAQDFHDTCVRKLRWDYFKATAQSLPRAGAGRPPALDATPFDPIRCDDPWTTLAVTRWRTFNRLYLGYFVALGSIAGAKSDSDAEAMKSFAAAINASGRFGSSDAVTTSANLLGAAMDEYFSYRRRNALSQFAAVKGTAFVNETAPGLVNAANVLDASLGEEEQAVNDWYVEGYRDARQGSDLQGLLAYRQSWAVDLSAVQARRDAIVAYRRAVADLQNSHATLVAAIGKNDPAALSSIVALYLTEFDPLVEKMNHAFK